jgi:hypothetical protein
MVLRGIVIVHCTDNMMHLLVASSVKASQARYPGNQTGGS